MPFGLYHSPVEVCVPVAQRVELGSEMQARELSADRLACVTLRGSECHFPKVLEGYDAVYEWVKRNGYRTDGPLLEVWISASGVEGLPPPGPPALSFSSTLPERIPPHKRPRWIKSSLVLYPLHNRWLNFCAAALCRQVRYV